MSNITEFPRQTPPDVIGTKRFGYDVMIPSGEDGVRLIVPHMHCLEEPDGSITFVVGINAFTFPKDLSFLAAAMAAQAMAVAVGAGHVTGSVNGNPFCQRARALDSSMLTDPT